MVKSNRVSFYDGALVLLFVILANLAAQSLFSFVFVAIDNVNPALDILQNVYVQLGGMVLIQAFYVGVTIIYFKFVRKARPLISYSITNKIKPISLLIMVAIGVVSLFCFYLPAAWFDTLLGFIGFKGSAGVSLTTAPQIIFGIIVMCVFAPLFEEYIFRGFLLSGLREKFGTIAAVLLSALAFCLMHMNPQQTVYQFILGAVCAYVTVNSGNIALAVGIHSVSNLIALMLDLTPLGAVFTAIMNALTYNWWISVINTLALVAIGGVIIYFCCKYLKKHRRISVQKLPLSLPFEPMTNAAASAQELVARKDKLGKRFYFIAIAVCALMWIFMFIAGFMTV